MLYTIAIVLLVLWALGLVSAYTLEGFHPYPAYDRCARAS